MNERESYEHMKKEVTIAIDAIRKEIPELADHLEEHLIMDDEKMTMQYTGDVKWITD